MDSTKRLVNKVYAPLRLNCLVQNLNLFISYQCNLRENKIAMVTGCSWNAFFVSLKVDIDH